MTDINDQILEFLGDIEDLTTSAEAVLDDEIPTGVAVDSVYPHPEDDEVRVDFELPQVESKTAAAFDVEYRDVSSTLTVWVPVEEDDQ